MNFQSVTHCTYMRVLKLARSKRVWNELTIWWTTGTCVSGDIWLPRNNIITKLLVYKIYLPTQLAFVILKNTFCSAVLDSFLSPLSCFNNINDFFLILTPPKLMGFYTPTERAGIYIYRYKLLNTVQLTIAFAQNEYTKKKKIVTHEYFMSLSHKFCACFPLNLNRKCITFFPKVYYYFISSVK